MPFESYLQNLPPVDERKILAFASDPNNAEGIEQALLIRALETILLGLFGKGQLHGTIHTCVGQELTGVFVGANLQGGDFLTSNHRCHGHFIGATGKWQGLIDEIVGNKDGVCGGIGSSQHLYSANFISNGQQGGLLPVAAGIALDRKRREAKNIVVSYIGEGTLGEGVFYETMNIASLWNLPHLVICENNFYSQSTPQKVSLAGDLGARAIAFGVEYRETDTWNPAECAADIKDAMGFVRDHCRPFFLIVKTYRLNPHSKGDDFRDLEELSYFRQRDPLSIMLREISILASRYDALTEEIAGYADQALTKSKMSPAEYFSDQLSRDQNGGWSNYTSKKPGVRIAQQLNQFYFEFLRMNAESFLLGEDIGDPYGGAFKVSSGLQSNFPDRVIPTPISEAAIVGVGIGLALAGNRPLVEIMFGDFMTLAFDQIINNASKFFHMYNRNVSCPVTVRSPMGGRRGYGPTHSQSLERFFVGIDNCSVVCLNSLVDVHDQLSELSSLGGPAIIFENKADYALHPFRVASGFRLKLGDAKFPTVVVSAEGVPAGVTIVSYGNMARLIADNLLEIFGECDLVPELIVPVAVHPLDTSPVCESVGRTGRLVIVEEGASFGGLGAEIASSVVERLGSEVHVLRIGAHPQPVPSVRELEDVALPSIKRICEAMRSLRET